MTFNRRHFLASLLPGAVSIASGQPRAAQPHLIDTPKWIAMVTETEKTNSGRTIKSLLENDKELSRHLNLALNELNKKEKEPFLISDFAEGDHRFVFEKYLLMSNLVHNNLSQGIRLNALSENTQIFLMQFARKLCSSLTPNFSQEDRRNIGKGIVPKRSWVDPNCESRTILAFLETGTVIAMGANPGLENENQKKKRIGPYKGGILHEGKALPHAEVELYDMVNKKYICAVGVSR